MNRKKVSVLESQNVFMWTLIFCQQPAWAWDKALLLEKHFTNIWDCQKFQLILVMKMSIWPTASLSFKAADCSICHYGSKIAYEFYGRHLKICLMDWVSPNMFTNCTIMEEFIVQHSQNGATKIFLIIKFKFWWLGHRSVYSNSGRDTISGYQLG